MGIKGNRVVLRQNNLYDVILRKGQLAVIGMFARDIENGKVVKVESVIDSDYVIVREKPNNKWCSAYFSGSLFRA
jgi:hypothetical protein